MMKLIYLLMLLRITLMEEANADVKIKVTLHTSITGARCTDLDVGGMLNTDIPTSENQGCSCSPTSGGKKKCQCPLVVEPECVLNGANQYSLTSTILEMILNTLHPTTTSLRPSETILTPDNGINMFIHDLTPLNAYQSMLDITTGTISNIWANYSPCPNCVRILLHHFKDRCAKPTIHVARIYTEGDNLSDVLESLQCLAKLKHNGFNIVAWNFNEFKAPGGVALFTELCNSAITMAYNNATFTYEFIGLLSHVTFINELGDSRHANSWCEI